MHNDDMLARLIGQAGADGADQVTLRALVEEASELGAARALHREIARRYGLTKIEAVIQPSRLETLKNAFAVWGVEGLTVTEVKGYGRQRGHGEVYRGAEYAIDFRPKLKVEAVVPTSLVPRLLDVLQRAVGTGRIGDGKVFVAPVEEAIRVRTGGRGHAIL